MKDALAAHLADESGFYESEHRILHRNGTFRWVLCRGAAVRNRHGAVTRLAGSLTDITDAKLVDALTGLPNRLLFVDLIERAIRRTERRQDYTQPGSTLARLGGDEFTVLLEDITDASDAIRVADRLRSALGKPFDVEEHQVFVSATVGITVSTTGDVRPGGRSAGRRHRAPSREGQRYDGP
jgi:GGDEF domain-containing protein